MDSWSTCNVTTRGSIYDTSHYQNRQIIRLFIYWLSLPLQSKYVSEMDVGGPLTI
jgi:hypothetical protein